MMHQVNIRSMTVNVKSNAAPVFITGNDPVAVCGPWD
jgi:hypothetical protein